MHHLDGNTCTEMVLTGSPNDTGTSDAIPDGINVSCAGGLLVENDGILHQVLRHSRLHACYGIQAY